MKKNELVWRELIDAAVVHGHRRWSNVDDVAFRAGVAPATASYALRRPIEIGAIQQHHAGFTVVNPEKVLTLSCAARSIVADAQAVVTISFENLQRLLASIGNSEFIVGGPGAAVELLGGVNTISDYSEYLYYVRDIATIAKLEERLLHLEASRHRSDHIDTSNVTFLVADPRAERIWQHHSSFAQTYADLFATPGWQASEFRLALHEKFLGKRDWDQE